MKNDRELLEEIHGKVTNTEAKVAAVEQALVGYNGQIGLCKQVENNTKQIARLWIVVSIILASTGGSAYGIIRLLMGV